MAIAQAEDPQAAAAKEKAKNAAAQQKARAKAKEKRAATEKATEGNEPIGHGRTNCLAACWVFNDDLVKRLAAEGKTVAEIAKYFGEPQKVIRKITEPEPSSATAHERHYGRRCRRRRSQ